MTSYPSFKKEVEGFYHYDDHARVVVDGNVITSRGPGTALVRIDLILIIAKTALILSFLLLVMHVLFCTDGSMERLTNLAMNAYFWLYYVAAFRPIYSLNLCNS